MMGGGGVPVRRTIARVLIVEDNVPLRAAIARRFVQWGATPVEAGTVQEALDCLDPTPDLIIIDVCLPDQPATTLLEAAANLWPVPLKIAISGLASPEQAFRLAQLGVRDFLSKPFSLDDLTATVEAACEKAPDVEHLITDAVGHVPMREVQGKVRSAMVKQALALTDGSRTGAARLLAVSRQAVQQFVRGRAPDPAGSDSADTDERPPAPTSPRPS